MFKGKVLELFAGSRSLGKICDKHGIECFSVDIEPFEGIDLVKDIMDVTLADIPFLPELIWASPPCTTYSVAGISYHRDGVLPTSDFAKISDELVQHTITLIQDFMNKNGGGVWYMENPVGMLRKMPFMENLDRRTVTYCQYGDSRMKPTDIWSNDFYNLFNEKGYSPRPVCRNGSSCHDAAPRGSRTGTQGLENAYERSKIPEELLLEILNHYN
jgi:site-specific DNA-cytosine methylase